MLKNYSDSQHLGHIPHFNDNVFSILTLNMIMTFGLEWGEINFTG